MAVKCLILALLISLLLISVVFTGTDAEPCISQNITEWSGTFQPPSFPLPYAPNTDCYWLLYVSEGNLVEINFQDFAMDLVPAEQADVCPSDYVEVLEGSYGSSDVIKRLCGLNLPSDQRKVRSKGNSLLVHMHTDDENHNRGFLARYTGICDVELSALSGTIYSPNHPQNYPSSVSCEWIIDLGPGYDITLTFHKFILETAENCAYDWLTVQEGNTADAPEIAKVCSDVLPPEITTRGPMRIAFQTDNDNEFEGFHVSYVAQVSMAQNATVESVAGAAASFITPSSKSTVLVASSPVTVIKKSANVTDSVQSIAGDVTVPMFFYIVISVIVIYLLK